MVHVDGGLGGHSAVTRKCFLTVAQMQQQPIVGQPVGPRRVVIAVPIAARVIAAPVGPPPPQIDRTHAICAQKLHITMAGLYDDELTNEDVLAFVRTKGVLLEWSIGDEIHPAPAPIHCAAGTRITTCISRVTFRVVIPDTWSCSI